MTAVLRALSEPYPTWRLGGPGPTTGVAPWSLGAAADRLGELAGRAVS